MEFRFTEAQETWRQEVRAFFRDELTEKMRAEMRERRDPFSPTLWKRLADRRYIGLSWPREYEGQERDVWDQLVFQEEAVLSGCPAAVMSSLSDITLLGRIVLDSGTPEQRREILPAAARGELTSAEGLTEPGAGSDLAGLETRAVRDGDDWILNGSKAFNMAHLTTHFLVLARTDPNLPRHRGLSFFLVDLKNPGVTVTPLMTIGRWRRNVVYFEDVRVPHSRLIGQLNRGWYHYVAPHKGLQAGMHSLSDARVAFNELLEYIKREQRDGELLAQVPWVRHAIADLAAELRAATMLAWQVAWLNTTGQEASKQSAMTKIATSEVQERVLSVALDILGPEGALESWGADIAGVPLAGRLPELYRTTRVWFIAGGTNEIKRNIIAQRGLGLPRD